MASLIPNILKESSQSRGETLIFNYFKNEQTITKDWIVLHSLDIAQHRKKKRGEADFIFLIPNKGILCVEVKAHSEVSRKEGIWYLGDQKGESPFDQVRDNSEVIIRQLKDLSLTYKTFVTDHPCGYEEPREVRVNLGASGVWMGTEQRLDGDFSVGVHAPVGKKSYLGLEVAASGLEAKSESKAYGSGDIQNGTESSDLRRLASGHGVASVNLGVFRPYAMVGVALVDESRKNSYEVFGQDKSIEDNGLEATIDAGVGFSVGKDIRLKVGEFYNSKMGPRTTVGLELEF